MTTILTIILSTFTLSTANTSLVVDAPQGGEAKILYYGPRVENADEILSAAYKGQSAYPAYGLGSSPVSAISLTEYDGSRTLSLKVASAELADTTLPQEEEKGQRLTISCKDPVYPVQVELVFETFPQQDVIRTCSRITNLHAKKSITLNRFDSGVLPLRYDDVWISTFYGTWANEGRLCEEPLERGFKLIRNTDGTRNSHTSHAEVMISPDGKPRENEGRVIGAALCWGGDYELRFFTGDKDFHIFTAGICPEGNEYVMEPKEVFTTPWLVYSQSGEGKSGVSRNFHRWGRKYALAHGEVERKVLLNSWEGVYFDINEPGMDSMMKDIASMGGELFVMDDGWFGEKYPRKNDKSSLGDWKVDRTKLPGGIARLVQMASDRGIRFGIWIEPEMTNNPSELYEAHPDWVLKAPGRDNVYGRGGTQLVLDLCNPKVQDYVVGVVDGLMSENPDIDYIKWDANMPMSSRGSQYLKKQSHVNIEYWRGFAKVCDRIRAKYPDITIQACASGGGRVNWGVLPWFDEFWTSDNTDALQRVYMQWGTSHFFPAIAMGSHISATPNHTVFRTTSLKYRCDVACSGRLGMEIQPANMTEAEKDFCRKVIQGYKTIRPVVQFGDIYRLVSPYDGKGCASMMYVSPDKEKAVFYWWKTANLYDEHFGRAVFRGLDPERRYIVHELNRIDLKPLKYEGKSFSGKFLMNSGLDIPANNECEWGSKSDWSSRVLYLTAE